MAQPTDKAGWLKFDGTVNWPLILTLLLTVGGAIGFGNKIVGQIDGLDKTMNTYSQEFKGLKESVDNIRLDMAKQEGMRTSIADHETRIRALELRK